MSLSRRGSAGFAAAIVFRSVTCPASLAGIDVELLPDRALFVPTLRTLIVADVHWGKASAFRALGVPVPHGTTQTGLDRLAAVIRRTQAVHLVILGDLLHARAGVQPRLLDALGVWRRAHAALEITLVRGNHDYRAGDPPALLDIACHDPPMHVGPFALHHHPANDPSGYVLAGHVHPVVQLRGRGRQRVTLPCFAFGTTGGVLPAFGEFTGGGVIDQRDYARLFVIADASVIALEHDASGQPP